MAEKVVLAYSGGLDTSVAIRWIGEKYHMDVITLTVDLGSERDLPAIQQKALNVGAIKALVVDAKEPFVKYFVFPALQADALYEGHYPLATALARPLIAKLLVDAANEEGAAAVAHGCTGKGNDQVRFDVSVAALAPHLRIIAPAREWGMSREEEIAYAQKHAIPVPVTVGSPYSIDENLWGRSIECGILEDPWAEPPEEVFAWTRSPKDAPDEPCYVEIGFERGIPIALDGREFDGVSLIQELNELAGSHGVGRIDHVENRLVGIKSREVYEAPAAMVLLAAHKALEAMTLSKDQLRFKEKVATEYADLIYNGLWFTALHQDLAAYVESSQHHVTGTVRVKLHKGNATVVGRKSPKSLYSYSLATYDKGDVFDQSASPGFIHIWGLPVKTQAQIQGVEEMEIVEEGITEGVGRMPNPNMLLNQFENWLLEQEDIYLAKVGKSMNAYNLREDPLRLVWVWTTGAPTIQLVWGDYSPVDPNGWVRYTTKSGTSLFGDYPQFDIADNGHLQYAKQLIEHAKWLARTGQRKTREQWRESLFGKGQKI